MNPSENVSCQVGHAKCQAQERASCVSEKACNAAQSAKRSCQEGGQQMKAKAQDPDPLRVRLEHTNEADVCVIALCQISSSCINSMILS